MLFFGYLNALILLLTYGDGFKSRSARFLTCHKCPPDCVARRRSKSSTFETSTPRISSAFFWRFLPVEKFTVGFSGANISSAPSKIESTYRQDLLGIAIPRHFEPRHDFYRQSVLAIFWTYHRILRHSTVSHRDSVLLGILTLGQLCAWEVVAILQVCAYWNKSAEASFDASYNFSLSG